MGTTYVVQTSGSNLNVRSGPGTSYPVVYTKSNGDSVTSYEERNGWVKISSAGNSWVSKSYLKPVFIDTRDAFVYTATNALLNRTQANNVSDYSNTVFEGVSTSTSNSDLQKSIRETLRAFGSPPRFLESTDPHYINDIDSGRVYNDTVLAHPTILSLMPCVVRYLPKFNKDEQKRFLDMVMAKAGGLSDKLLGDDKLSGPLYKATSAYNGYMKSVNMLCRTVAVYLGLGDQTVPGSSTKYSKYDWSFKTSKSDRDTGDKQGIWDIISQADDVVLGDGAYIHFFCNQPGVDISESISTSLRESAMSSLFNGSISDIAKDLNYLTGGGLSAEANLEMDQVMTAFGDNTFATLLRYGKEYFNGARMQFPQMVDNMTYGKSLGVSMRFTASSGSVEAIYNEIFVPVCHLLAFGLPRQVNENQYTYPFLCRAVCPGRFDSDLAVITDISIDKGGDGGRWTINNLPTEVDAHFTITPLYSQLMVSSTDHPLLALKNTPLIEYLSVMCGIDSSEANMDIKRDILLSTLSGKFTDMPKNFTRSIFDTKPLSMMNEFIRSRGL